MYVYHTMEIIQLIKERYVRKWVDLDNILMLIFLVGVKKFCGIFWLDCINKIL